MKLTIEDIQWHRNGISGEGFYAIIFTDPDEGRMVATLYDEVGYCSVLHIEKLSNPTIGVRFGTNSWRGDYYEDTLRSEVEKWNSSGRLGPFSMIPPEAIDDLLSPETS